jgi:AhpD family alkylhydroperoxidase
VSARVDLVDPTAAPILARRFFSTVGETSPIVRALAQVPELLAPTMEFLRVVLGASAIDERTKELVILRVSATASCSYCIAAHRVAAADSGVTADESAALLGRSPLDKVFGAHDRSILAVADAIAAGGEVPAGVISDLRRRSGSHGVVEIVLVASATLMLNRFCTALGVPITVATMARLVELDRPVPA